MTILDRLTNNENKQQLQPIFLNFEEKQYLKSVFSCSFFSFYIRQQRPQTLMNPMSAKKSLVICYFLQHKALN